MQTMKNCTNMYIQKFKDKIQAFYKLQNISEKVKSCIYKWSDYV